MILTSRSQLKSF